MLPELGQIALLLALLAALLQAVFPLVGAAGGRPAWMAVGRPAAYAQLLLLGFAYAVLTDVNGGSKLLISVRRAAHGHDRCDSLRSR